MTSVFGGLVHEPNTEYALFLNPIYQTLIHVLILREGSYIHVLATYAEGLVRLSRSVKVDWKSKVIFHPPGPHNIVLTCLGPETIVKTENGLQDVVMGVYGTGFELARILRYADTGYFAFEARREPLLVLSELRDHTTAETRARDFDHMYT